MADRDLIALAREHGAMVSTGGFTGTNWIQFTGEELQAFCAALTATKPKAEERCETCGSTEPYSGSCGTSDSDTKALCKRPKADERGSAEPEWKCSACGVSKWKCVCNPVAKVINRPGFELYTLQWMVDAKTLPDGTALYTHPDSAQARDAAQAVELTEGELAKVYLTLDGGERGYPMLWSIKHLSRAIERAVLAKNGLGGKPA